MGLLFHMLQPPVKRPGWLRFLVTVVSLAVAFGARDFLDPWLRWHSPFALLMPAVLVSAWYGGARAGLLATVAGGIGAVYRFMPTTGLVIRDVSDAVSFLLFLCEGAMVSSICGVVHYAINRAQVAAAEAGRKFEIMANNAPVLIWSTDPVGRCVFVNHNWLTFTGRTSHEELSTSWPAHVHPADLPAYLRSFTHASTSKRSYQVEYRLRRADGTYRWLLEHAVPRYDTDGCFEGFIGSCTDITVSRREREELDFVARLQRSFGASLDLERVAGALADAAVPHLADWFQLELVHDSGRLEILRTHQTDPARGAALLAATAAAAPGSLLGSSTRVVETGEVQFTPVVDATLLSAGATDAAQQERLRNLGLVSHLAVPLLARGRIIGVLTLATAGSGRLLEAPELSLVQRISGIVGFALDNARLYRRTLRALDGAEEARQKMAESEQALDRHRALLQTIIDSVPALVAYIGPDGRFALHNGRYREWLGLETAAIIGQPLAEVGGGRMESTAALHLQAALAGDTVSYENVIHSAGADRRVATTLRPDRDPAGRVRGVVFHAYDITERDRAYAELTAARELLRCHADELEERVRERTAKLRETNAELEAFTYSVSHDLRTPLQFVRSFAEAIAEDPHNGLSADSGTYLERIIRATTRMESIIHDLLGYSRLARADLSLTSISLDDAVGEAVSHHQAGIQATGAQLQIEAPLPRVNADRVGLFQILSNLISNALKFTVPGRVPVIRVRAEVAEDFTRLWISDNGIGIPLRHHEKIFQLFERLHSATEFPGTGIGLALVRKAATRMGGNCGVESAPGAGSRFWIDFPDAEARAPEVTAQVTARPNSHEFGY